MSITFWSGRFGACVADELTLSAGFAAQPISTAADWMAQKADSAAPTVWVFGDSRYGYLRDLTALMRPGSEGIVVDLMGRELLVGPRLTADGPCLSCCTRRYLAMPGGQIRTEWEQGVAREISAGAVLAFGGYDACAVATAAELIRSQLARGRGGAFIRLDLLSMHTLHGVATPCSDCSCGTAERDPNSEDEALQAWLEGAAAW